MSKYILCDWEINGYNDSDFVCMYYDMETKELRAHTYGTTRAAAPTSYGFDSEGRSTIYINRQVEEKAADGTSTYKWVEATEPLLYPTVEAVEAARQVLSDSIFTALTVADKRLRDQPGPENLSEGMKLRLTASVRNQVAITEPCRKCNGTGKWENPRNSADKRDCFACHGEGTHKVGKVKTEDGKLKYDVIPTDTVGEVVEWGSFGTFYRNGYNQPNRENTSVQLRMSDGKVFRATLAKCRMDRDYATPESLKQTAEELSYNYQFQCVGGVKCAWLTRNLAAEVVSRAKQAQVSV